MEKKAGKKHVSTIARSNTRASESSCELHIKGMHCPSCEVLLERRLLQVPGVKSARVNHIRSTAAIVYSRKPSAASLRSAIDRDGYSLVSGDAGARDAEQSRPAARDYFEVAIIFAALVSLYFLLRQLEIFSSIGISDSMSLGVVFLIGLIAGTSSCLAVTGGLLLALAAKYGEANPSLTGAQKFKPTLYFNLGRIIGYTLFGAVLGSIGGFLALSPAASGVLTLLAAAIMIVLGVQMLHIVPFIDRLSPSMPKWLAHRVYEGADGTYKPWAPFVLGAGTFFVPCGFTQALQFYVLAHGSVTTGALTMLVFSLGTLPMLLGVGALSSFTKGTFHRHFIRVAAALVVLLGMLSIRAGFTLVSLGW